MARARTTATRSSNGIVVVQQPVPVARTSSGGLRRRRSSGGGGKRRRSRRSSGGSVGSSSIQSRIQRTALGGFVYGQIVKNLPNLPRLPLLGRSGTIAAAVWLLKPKSQLLQDVGIAAAAIAGASFGETGTVSGSGEEVLESE